MEMEILKEASSQLINGGGAFALLLLIGLAFLGRWFLNHLEGILREHKGERLEWRNFLNDIVMKQDSRQKETNLVIEGLTNVIQRRLMQDPAPARSRRNG